MQVRALVPRIGRWASKRWASPFITMFMVIGLLSVAVGNSMAMVGAPRAVVLGAAGRRGIGTTVSTATITSSPTNALATATSNQKKEASLSTGREVYVVGATATNAEFWWSDDGGATKTQYTSGSSDIGGWSNGSIDKYVDSGGTERLVAAWKQSGTSGTGPTGGARTDGYVYVAVGSFNTGRTSLTWGAAVTLWSGTTTIGYLDIVVHAESTGGVAHIVTSQNTGGGTNFTNYKAVTIDSSGVGTAGSPSDIGGSYGVNVDTFPSICLDPATNHLHVAWSAGTTGSGKGIRYRKSNTTTGSRTFATEVEVDNGHYLPGTAYGLICRWDASGSRVVIGGMTFTGSLEKRVLWDSTNFTSFTNRDDTTVSGTTFMLSPGMAVDAATGDVYLYGSWLSGGTYGGVHYYKWTRATLTMGAEVITEAHDAHSASNGCGVYAWYSSSRPAIRWIYTTGSGSPYTIKVGTLT